MNKRMAHSFNTETLTSQTTQLTETMIKGCVSERHGENVVKQNKQLNEHSQ